MQKITSITDDAKQRMTINLENNEGSFEFALYYLPTQYSWYYDFIYNDYESYGNKVVLNINALRYLKKLIPFGIMFMSIGDVEPFKQDDFSSGRINMYVLNSDDVQYLESNIYG